MQLKSFGTIAIVIIMSCLHTAAFGWLVADSVADFSGVQGQNGWYYGYYDGPYAPSDFQLMPNFNSEVNIGGDNPGAWNIDYLYHWTTIWCEGMVPNGYDGTSNAYTEHWATRRWVSTVSGPVNISGRVAQMNNPPGHLPGGDGVTARIFVDGASVWSGYVGGYNTEGIEYSIDVLCRVGSEIDFAMSPGQSMVADHFIYTAKISAGPEVCEASSVSLALLAVVPGLAFYRRKR